MTCRMDRGFRWDTRQKIGKTRSVSRGIVYSTGAVEPGYVDEMVMNIKRNGPYIVVCPETALPHASAEQGVIEEVASILRLKEPIDFHSGNNDPVRYVIGMSIQSAKSINSAIYDLMMIFGNEQYPQKIRFSAGCRSCFKYDQTIKFKI